MPSMAANTDEWVASAVNYVRYEYGKVDRGRRPSDTISPFVTPAEVKMVRSSTASRNSPWTISELENGETKMPVTQVSTAGSAHEISTGFKGTRKNTNAKGNNPSVAKSAVDKKTSTKSAVASATKASSYDEVKNLLQKNTCLACHNTNTKVIGPAYKDIAKQRYSVAQIIQLIYKPNPQHWPEYKTRMPPMPQVSQLEARKIAEWIKSLEKVR
jgi:cytochrome c551/c552